MIYPVGTTFTGPPVVGEGVSFTSVSNLDSSGLAFATSGGTLGMFGFFAPNSAAATGNAYGQIPPPGAGSFGVGLFDLTPVPLPATLPLFASGLGAMGLLGWRRKRRAQSVS